MDNIIYEVEFPDEKEYEANAISKALYSQADNEGNE